MDLEYPQRKRGPMRYPEKYEIERGITEGS
jgi:hypothetical protein